MTTIALTYRAIHHKITSVNFPRIPWKLICSLAVLLFLLLSVFYIFLVNDLTRGVYVIKNYHKEINNLLSENRILETHFAKSDFLKRTMDKAKEMSFEKTTNVTYVQILESSLVQREPSNIK